MRRLSGTLDNVEYVLLEYACGMVECPSVLRETLQEPDGSFPTGEALENACRVLFGESLTIREMD